jgi:hypothetical protein
MMIEHPNEIPAATRRRLRFPIERRRADRLNLPYVLSAFDQRTLRLVGHVLDIDTLGMRVIGERPLDRDRDLSLWLQVPGWCSDDQGAVLLDVQSRWSHVDDHGGWCETGFRITDMTPEAAEGIANLLADLQ